MSIYVPTPSLPKPLDIPPLYFKPPSAKIPYYKNMVIPPADLERPAETEPEESQKTEQPPARKLEIPVIDIQMPLPTAEVMVTAVTAALGAVATTTLAQPLFEQIKKFVTKQLNKRIETWKKKRKAQNQASLKNSSTE